ncbi:hypothetical protein JKP88DRAFT_248919 [Tribonema minus]|uniref:Uncharacterized protein n=1 Tax=Tribonema minus TaxID=303371 RepID=A0A836C9W4_9STRA|nr:hypothetical protein JKP88DRAFT_248919 [Tribonema minus]
MSVPSELSFPKLRSAAVAAVSTTYKCTPSNSGSTWQPGNILQFDIPTGIRSQHLDPAQTWLYFEVTSTIAGGTSPGWQAKPWSFIKQLQVFSSAGSQLLETTGEYGALFDILRTVGSTEDHAKYSDSITMNIDPTRPRQARAMVPDAAGMMKYAIPLSSILGLQTAGQMFIPTHALSSPLRIELTLQSAGAALACSGGTVTGATYSVSNPYISCGLITVSDICQQQLTQMVNQSSGGAYTFNAEIWRNYRNVHAANQLTNSILIPARFSSLKALLTVFRESAVLEDVTKYSQDFIRSYLKNYQVKVGSSYVNPQPVDCSGNGVPAFMELKKVFCGLTNQSQPTLITLADWVKDTSTAPTTTSNGGAFMVGVELEPFSNNRLLSGTSTVGTNMFLDLTFAPNAGNGEAVPALTIDSFVQADALFTIGGGQMTVRSADRVNSTDSVGNYEVFLPYFPDADYACTVQCVAANLTANVGYSLQLKSPAITRALTTGQDDGWYTVCVLNGAEISTLGTLYFSRAPKSIRLMQMNNYIVNVSSLDRISGDQKAFTVKLPLMPDGNYECEVVAQIYGVVRGELQFRCPQLARSMTSRKAQPGYPWVTVLTFVQGTNEVAKGSVQFTGAPSIMDVQLFQSTTDLPFPNASLNYDKSFTMHFKRIEQNKKRA